MTIIKLEIGKPAEIRFGSPPVLRDVNDWCDDCFLDRPSFKCHLAIGRPEHDYLNDEIKYKRPQSCKALESNYPPVKELFEKFLAEIARRVTECREHQAKCEAMGQYEVSGLQQVIIGFYEQFHDELASAVKAMELQRGPKL